jgi:hypothetical protein
MESTAIDAAGLNLAGLNYSGLLKADTRNTDQG